jgi:hypothetical protein
MRLIARLATHTEVLVSESRLSQLSEQAMLQAIEESFNAQIDEDEDEFHFNNLYEHLSWKDKVFILESTGWYLQMVEDFGGEGHGDQYWFVFTVTDGETTRHVKVDGWYASYSGGEYDEWFEVKPEQKMVTVWTQS